MKNEIKVFTKQLLILASIIGIIIITMMYILPVQFLTPTLPYLLVFHTAATLISFSYIHKKTEKHPTRFVNAYLTNTTVKLLIYLAILLVYSLNNIPDAVNFIISFFILYLIFTVFEVICILRINKKVTH